MKRYIFLIVAWHCMTMIPLAGRQDKECQHTPINHDGFVELNDDIVKVIINLERLLPNYAWSKEFKELFNGVDDGAIIAPHTLVKTVIEECIASCTQLTHTESKTIHATLEQYQNLIETGNAYVQLADLEDQTLRKTKKICTLCVSCLNVSKRLLVNGIQITGNDNAAYGQLSVLSQVINFTGSDEWTIIPFDEAGPSSSMNVSLDSPATITIQKSGAYQVNFSTYLLAEDSDEGPFFSETYTLGLSINGTTTPITAIIANDAGQYPVVCSKIVKLFAGDVVQFYMKASDISPEPIFVNHTTLQNGNAHLIQISNA